MVCLFCWSFQKTSSWIYWFFWRVFRASISFSSALILVISFLLLGFEFFWSCSSSSFNFDDRVSILDLSILLACCFEESTYMFSKDYTGRSFDFFILKKSLKEGLHKKNAFYINKHVNIESPWKKGGVESLWMGCIVKI